MTRVSLGRDVPSILAGAADLLVREGIDSYLVGGYIRDTLLGRATSDIDIAVAGAAPQVAQKLAEALHGRYVLLDEANGIARVVVTVGDAAGEAQWHLDISTIRGSIEADLSRRDFTIDAMAIDLREAGEGSSASLIDPFQGKRDLEKRLIRAVGDTAFENDPARLIRAVRLAAGYGFTIEGETEVLLSKQSQLIRQVAGERVREELCRILASRNAARFLFYLDRLGLLTAIVPELAATKGVEQPREHYWDVFHHSIETVAALERLLNREKEIELLALAPHLVPHIEGFEEEIGIGVTRAVLMKLAALLHDIAKPQTKTMEADGRARFLGHTKEGGAIAGGILQRLRFSNRETGMVQKMIEAHLRLWQMGGDHGMPTRRAIYRYFRDTGDVSIDIMFLTLADFLATQGPNLDLTEWRRHCGLMEYVLSQREEDEALVRPPKLLDGDDLMKILGLKPGPKVGELLEAVREAQGAGEIATREEALAFALGRLAEDKPTGKVV
ncbi:MAG: HD domain-containing protein [Chloroflexi bacterium]|nr:HD domain-containing protein [Chloroflexota bacterium]